MSTEPAPRPATVRKPVPSTRVTQADLERFDDEDLMREARHEARLREETPPHHR
jgi:hypothetical protein